MRKDDTNPVQQTKHGETEKNPGRRAALLIICCGIVGVMLLQSGLAPATVEEQRRRLPPPAEDCSDPVEGVWMGHQLLNGYWYRFTLDVRRTAPGSEQLEGSIESHFWDGGPDQTTPPPCEGGNSHQEFIVDMPAEGTFKNNRISFIGQSWSLREEICGRYTGGYYPDGFSGELIEENTEFHTQNDDGYNPITTVVFRRIRCGSDQKPVPNLPDTPPPPEYSSGCGGCF